MPDHFSQNPPYDTRMKGLLINLAVLVMLSLPSPKRALSQNRCTLSISVVDTLEQPVRGALVRLLPGGDSGRTDDRGKFVFRDVPVEAPVLNARAIGYLPAHFSAFCPGRAATAIIHLIRAPISLDTVRVTSSPADPTGFRARMAHSRGGYFRTDSAIARLRPGRITELLLTIPGVTLRRGNLGLVVELGGRGAKRADEKPCPVVFFLDGTPFETSAEGIDSDLAIGQIAAVEAYSVASVPAQYSPLGANCGVILLWTKASQTTR